MKIRSRTKEVDKNIEEREAEYTEVWDLKGSEKVKLCGFYGTLDSEDAVTIHAEDLWNGKPFIITDQYGFVHSRWHTYSYAKFIAYRVFKGEM